MYQKWLFALLQVAVVALLAVTDPLTSPVDDGSVGAVISPGEWVFLVESIAAGALVVVVPNLNGGVAKYTKAIVFGVLSVTALGLSWALDGITVNDVLMVVSAFLLGAGVWQRPAPVHQAVAVQGQVLTVRDEPV